MTDHPYFTTEGREASTDEMGWGTESGQSWSEAIAQSDGVTVGGGDISPAETQSGSVIDHFEGALYEDLGRSLEDVYTGELGQFNRQQSVVYYGDWALELGNIGFNGMGVITDTNELNYLSPGESVEWFSRGESVGGVTRGPAPSLLIGVQSEVGKDSLSGYSFDIRYRYESCGIRRFDAGSSRNIYIEDNGTTPLPSQTWHRCRVDWGVDGTLRLRVWDEFGELLFDESVSDMTYTTGGIGWLNQGDDRSNNGAAWVDAAIKI